MHSASAQLIYASFTHLMLLHLLAKPVSQAVDFYANNNF